MATTDQFNGIGDDLTAHQRGLHPFGAHRYAVTDSYGIELHWRTTGRAYALFHFDRKVAQVVVTGHRFNPGIGYANNRASQVVIGKADAFKHSARACTVTPIRNRAATLFGIECHGGLHYHLPRYKIRDVSCRYVYLLDS